jgi:hypothetical protein
MYRPRLGRWSKKQLCDLTMGVIEYAERLKKKDNASAWVTIAQRVGRSTKQCEEKWKSIRELGFPEEETRWNTRRDEQLVRLVKQHVGWYTIAMFMDVVNPETLVRRYKQILGKGSKTVPPAPPAAPPPPLPDKYPAKRLHVVMPLIPPTQTLIEFMETSRETSPEEPLTPAPKPFERALERTHFDLTAFEVLKPDDEHFFSDDCYDGFEPRLAFSPFDD